MDVHGVYNTLSVVLQIMSDRPLFLYTSIHIPTSKTGSTHKTGCPRMAPCWWLAFWGMSVDHQQGVNV